MATAVETDSLLKDAALIVDVCFSVEEGDVVKSRRPRSHVGSILSL